MMLQGRRSSSAALRVGAARGKLQRLRSWVRRVRKCTKQSVREARGRAAQRTASRGALRPRPRPALRHAQDASSTGQGTATQAARFTDLELRNIALEAVRAGDFWAEDQAEVLAYIAELFVYYQSDAEFLRMNQGALGKENGLTRLYTVEDILAKKHEKDGYNIFVDPDEAVALFEAAKRGPRQGPADMEPGALAEVQEHVGLVVAAMQGDEAPLGVDELLGLLERCAGAGELSAATFCAERLEAAFEGGMPDDVLDRVFSTLKPLMRPSARRNPPLVQGPWSQPGGSCTHRSLAKRFGQLIMDLAQTRKQRLALKDGLVAERMEHAKLAEEALQRLASMLAPVVLANPVACKCRRRGLLAATIAELCEKNGLPISQLLAFEAVNSLRGQGVVRIRGRQVDVIADASQQTASQPSLAACAADLATLERCAKERAERRKLRKQAREKRKAVRL